jgi:hypothetical protein
MQTGTGQIGYRIRFGYAENARAVILLNSNKQSYARLMVCWPCLHCNPFVACFVGGDIIGLPCTPRKLNRSTTVRC